MVVRKEKRNRKYHGTRRWGVGNIKNARGKGDQGGTGSLNRLRKHDWTYFTAKARDQIRKKGFVPWHQKKLREITLNQISALISGSKEQKPVIELKEYKVLSNGALTRAATIRAAKFSKNAEEKIKKSGGEAVVVKPSEEVVEINVA